ncbi:MAG TPA: GNAT family N-acetyltransferase [Anaerolineales bacterium]|nr:GNAT family N-acetyltransferase [Anaerolineales bacterium]
MNIRKAISEDTLLLSTLCMDVQQLHAQSHPSIFKTPQSPDFAFSFFEKMLQDDTMYIYIAEENGQALGYIFFKVVERDENPFLFARHYLLIDQISVRPEAQGQGVGKALIQQVEVVACELGISSIHLGSWDFNTSAHGFFERMGYEQRYFEFWKMLED